MIQKPVKVPERRVDSIDITKFDGGQYLKGPETAPKNAITVSRNVEITAEGYLTPRRRLTKFLPDTVGTSYQKFPVLWDDEIYYFTMDQGKVKFCQEFSSSWTDCGGTNTFSTGTGMPKFLRTANKVLILNGKNGDRLAYVDLQTAGFPVVTFTSVSDPGAALTPALTGLSAGALKIYYAFSYSGAVGETKLSPPLTVSINKSRDEWSTLGTPGSIKLTRAAAPAGAKFWNVYVAIAATGGTIQDEDFLLLASGLDTGVVEFVDNGTLAINLGSVAPTENGTEGPRVDQGIIAEDRPILFADKDNPYAIWIGATQDGEISFTTAKGGYKAEPQKGTNYYPTTIIGFRTGQGVPALTVLYSNTEGLSKQAVIQQQTVNYGDSTFTVWGITEQNYGAAGVAAPNSAINYNGRLMFLSTDGFMSMETQPSVQNVLSTKPVSSPVDPYVRSIKTSVMDRVVGTGWGSKYMWLVPSYGFDTPQEIFVLDTNNAGIDGDGAWYPLNIAADWIGTINPADAPAFVYVSIGNETYKLLDLATTFDFVSGVAQPFSTYIEGPVISSGGEAHNGWMALVQAPFYLLDVLGDVEVGVKYRNQSGKLKVKSKIFHGSVAAPSTLGGWGDPQWTYAGFPQIPGYISFPIITGSAASLDFQSARVKVRVDDIASEMQWFLKTESGYNNYKFKAVSFEGINLGIKPDLS